MLFLFVLVFFDSDAYLCKLGLKGIPISDNDDDDNSEKDDENEMAIEEGNNSVKNDNDNDNVDDDNLDEEQKLMKSMGLPVAFASDMLRIGDSDDETQVTEWVFASDILNQSPSSPHL